MALGMYKPDQGYWTRTCSAIAAFALTAAAMAWIVRQIDRFNFEASTASILQWSLAGTILIIGAGLTYLLVYQRQKSAEFLIATEGEMKKVNWSTRREVMGSTWVVITVSLTIAVILWFVDLGFSTFFQAIRLLAPDG
ncbi:MAG: preprotein translocase subunit SecE [Phycisphaerales bacterium]